MHIIKYACIANNTMDKHTNHTDLVDTQFQISLIPRPIPTFSMLHADEVFQCATLKSWEWTWGRGYFQMVR